MPQTFSLPIDRELRDKLDQWADAVSRADTPVSPGLVLAATIEQAAEKLIEQIKDDGDLPDVLKVEVDFERLQRQVLEKIREGVSDRTSVEAMNPLGLSLQPGASTSDGRPSSWVEEEIQAANSGAGEGDDWVAQELNAANSGRDDGAS